MGVPRRYVLLLGVLATISLSSAAGPPGTNSRVLVVVETSTTAQTHSKLLQSLIDKGYDLTVRPADTSLASDLALVPPGGGEYWYGGVVLLCPTSRELRKKLSLSTLERFIDAGNNLFISAGPEYSSLTREIVQSVGVDLDAPKSRVIDHQNIFAPLDSGDHTFVKAGGRATSSHLFANAFNQSEGDIVFNGPGASLFADNELVESVIWGSGSSYSYKPSQRVTDSPHESGSATVLAATLPTRVGSRVVYFGSIDALSDAVFKEAGNVHEEALTSLVAWTFGHSGILRAQNLRFQSQRVGSADNGIRVKDLLQFSVDIQQWDGSRQRWGEYVTDDMQLEFVMLNPWVRTRLQHLGNGDASTYRAIVPVPDQIGIYKFVISYHRTGVSPVDVSHVVPVRPFLHNEFPRFIVMAAPYYAASFVMLGVVFLLGGGLLFGGAFIPSADKHVETNSAENRLGLDKARKGN